MGIPSDHCREESKPSSGKMRSLVALTLFLAAATGSMMMKKKIHHDMMMMNSQAMCWGHGNMMYYKMAMMKAMEECHDGHTSNIQAKNPFSGSSFNKKPPVNPDSLKSILFSNFD